MAENKPPAWRSFTGVHRVVAEMRALKKALESEAGQKARPRLHELRMPDEKDCMTWQLRVSDFDEKDTRGGKQLNQDLAQLASTTGAPASLLLELSFPPDFPTSPFSVRVVTPRCKMYTGHVTVGGSVCLQALVATGQPGGWEPTWCVEPILALVLQNMVDTETVHVSTAANPTGGLTGPLRVNLGLGRDALKPYSRAEAEHAQQRAIRQHAAAGWGGPPPARPAAAPSGGSSGAGPSGLLRPSAVQTNAAAAGGVFTGASGARPPVFPGPVAMQVNAAAAGGLLSDPSGAGPSGLRGPWASQTTAAQAAAAAFQAAAAQVTAVIGALAGGAVQAQAAAAGASPAPAGHSGFLRRKRLAASPVSPGTTDGGGAHAGSSAAGAAALAPHAPGLPTATAGGSPSHAWLGVQALGGRNIRSALRSAPAAGTSSPAGRGGVMAGGASPSAAPAAGTVDPPPRKRRTVTFHPATALHVPAPAAPPAPAAALAGPPLQQLAAHRPLRPALRPATPPQRAQAAAPHLSLRPATPPASPPTGHPLPWDPLGLGTAAHAANPRKRGFNRSVGGGAGGAGPSRMQVVDLTMSSDEEEGDKGGKGKSGAPGDGAGNRPAGAEGAKRRRCDTASAAATHHAVVYLTGSGEGDEGVTSPPRAAGAGAQAAPNAQAGPSNPGPSRYRPAGPAAQPGGSTEGALMGSAGGGRDDGGGEGGEDDVVVVAALAASPPKAPHQLLAQLAAREAELAAKEAELAAREAEIAALRQADRSLLCTAPLPSYWEPYSADEDPHAVKFVVLPFEGDAEYVDRFATKLAQYESYIESLVPSGRGGRKRGAALLQQQEALIPLDDVQGQELAAFATKVAGMQQEVKRILDRWTKSGMKVAEIQRIERVQNWPLWTRYTTCVDHMVKARNLTGGRTDKDLNERYLFHGTARQQLGPILKNGLDIRKAAHHGQLGAGAYLSESATYSLKYCQAGPRAVVPMAAANHVASSLARNAMSAAVWPGLAFAAPPALPQPPAAPAGLTSNQVLLAGAAPPPALPQPPAAPARNKAAPKPKSKPSVGPPAVQIVGPDWTEPDLKGSYGMLVCKGLLGRVYKGGASHLREPPPGYDSSGAHQIYAVYDNGATYPEYLIHFNRA